jgi:hypothetical protein
MAAPVAGRARRPSRVRVADAELAAQVREAVPDIDVVVAPTPELDRIVHLIRSSISQDDNQDLSCFEGGRISAEAVERLFHASDLLYGLSPWETA